MSELTYGEHLYNYLSGLDYEGLNFEEAEAREWVSEVEALLRVARAAKEATSNSFAVEYDVPGDMLDLYEALKEVEHLLGVDK